MSPVHETCLKCDNIATLMCQRCHDPYCSTQCQVADWRSHKTKCIQMPGLIPVKKIVINNVVAQPLQTVEVPKKIVPKAHVSPAEALAACNLSDNWQDSIKPHGTAVFEVNLRYIEETIDAKVYWLRLKSQEDNFQKLMLHIHKSMRNATPLTLPQLKVGKLVVALHGQAYRAEVLYINELSNAAVVRRIDVGDQMQLDITALYAAFDFMYKQPAFVFGALFKSAPNNLEVDDVLTVCMSPKGPTVEGYCNLLLKHNNSPAAEQAPLKEPSSIIKIKLLKIHGISCIYLTLDQPEFAAEYKELHASLQKCKLPSGKSEFVAGQPVAALQANIWHRAILLCADIVEKMHLVYLIDEGSVRFCQQITNLPASHLKQAARIIIVKIQKQEALPNLTATGTMTIKRTANCELKIGDFVCAGKQIKPAELFESGDFGYWSEGIENGARAYISFVQSINEVWAFGGNLILLRKILEKYASKCEAFEKDGEDMKKCTILTRVGGGESGEMYIRGIILNSHPGIVEVCDVDTSIVYYVDPVDILRAVPIICALPAQLALISLDVPENIDLKRKNEALITLKKYVDSRKMFMVQTNAENPSKANLVLVNEQGVTSNLSALLFAANGTAKPEQAVNKPKTEEKKKQSEEVRQVKAQDTALAANEFNQVDIPEKDSVTLFVIDTSEIESNKTMVAASMDGTDIVKAMQNVTYFIEKYREQSGKSNEGYSPALNEFCLAKFKEDNEWYRARCTKIMGNGNFELHFIDYGNHSDAEMKDIMGPLPKELKGPIYANLCHLKDVSDLAALVEKIHANPIIKCKVSKEKGITYVTPI